MTPITKSIMAAAATVVLGLGAVAPAAAAPNVTFSFHSGSDRAHAKQAFGRYCQTHRRDPDCQRFLRGQFRDRDYYTFYNTHRTQLTPFGAFFGFALGSVFAGAAAAHGPAPHYTAPRNNTHHSNGMGH
jgi:hypothetical protein